MLQKDYYPNGSEEKTSGRGSQGAWRQDELIDSVTAPLPGDSN
jgi:hypothetical protein